MFVGFRLPRPLISHNSLLFSLFLSHSLLLSLSLSSLRLDEANGRKRRLRDLLTDELLRFSQSSTVTPTAQRQISEILGITLKPFVGHPAQTQDVKEKRDPFGRQESQIGSRKEDVPFSVRSVNWDVRGRTLIVLLTIQNRESHLLQFRSIALHSPPESLVTGGLQISHLVCVTLISCAEAYLPMVNPFQSVTLYASCQLPSKMYLSHSHFLPIQLFTSARDGSNRKISIVGEWASRERNFSNEQILHLGSFTVSACDTFWPLNISLDVRIPFTSAELLTLLGRFRAFILTFDWSQPIRPHPFRSLRFIEYSSRKLGVRLSFVSVSVTQPIDWPPRIGASIS
jgi:hypothetical protein